MEYKTRVLLLAMAMVYTVHGQSTRPEYDRMIMDNGTSLYVAGRNVLYHFNQTDLEEIASVTIGPYNHTDVNVTLLELAPEDATRAPALMYCTSAHYNCYSLNLTNINDVIENGTKILSGNAVALLVRPSNKPSVWFIACPHQVTYQLEDRSFCTKPGLFRSNDLKQGSENDLSVKFKSDGVAERAQTKEFIAGFTDDSSTLFFSIQGWTSQTSHVAHTCIKNEQRLKLTYIEVPISCGSNNILTDVKKDGLLFVASFTNQRRDGSAICVYNLQEIKARLADNMKKCYKAQYEYGTETDYIGESRRCTRTGGPTNSSIDNILCYGLESYFGVIGDLAIDATPVVEYNNQVIRAITLAKRQDAVMAFFGSDQQINKAVIYPNNKTARKLDTLFAVDGPLQKDLLNDGFSVFALTKSQIHKFPMANCSTKSTCHQCLADGDPDCGWCILGNKCSPTSECEDAHIWIPAKNRLTGSCPVISRIVPDVINVKDSLQNITIHITPDIDISNFKPSCTYTTLQVGYSFSRNVRAVPNLGPGGGITCSVPYEEVRSYMDRMRGTMVVKVSVASAISTKPLVESHITYYNCDTFTKCMKCVDTNWTCNWCPYANSCVDRGTDCSSRPDTMLSTKEECPICTAFSFNETLSDGTGTLIVTKDKYNIVIGGSNFLQPSADLQYSCETRFRNAISFTASYINSTAVECLVNLTSQTSHTGTLTTKLSLKFGPSQIDGLTQNVQFYDCGKLVNPSGNCGECKSFAYYKPHYKCQWCQGRCVYTGESCSVSNQNSPCPSPTITKVWPLSAFINSTTRVDISGYNLGSHFNETIKAVTIAGLPCTSVEELYNPSKGISCLVGPSNESINGQVRILMQDRPQSVGPTFYFRTPQITSVCPEYGPCSGGTMIYIKGINLDTGRERNIYISGVLCEKTKCVNSTCYADNQSSTTLCCHTGRANATMVDHQYSVDLEFDGQPVSPVDVIYSYAPDPIIESISPKTSFRGGGRMLTVIGQNLLTIQDPKIYLKYRSKTRTSFLSCKKNETVNRPGEQQKIYCPSPTFTRGGNKRRLGRSTERQQREINTILAFEMDGVDTVGNLSADIATITYYPDPIIKPFPETQTYQNILKIEGENLNKAATRDEVFVWIGSVMKCNVTTLEKDLIYCNPPPKPPVDLKDHAAYFQVEVQIGFFSKEVGFIKYDVEDTSGDEDMIIGVVVTCVVLLAIGIIVPVLVLCWKRKMHKQKKTMEYRMEKKEAKLREQCRKEFAGLQTVMSDLTGDLAGGNVLFRDYDVYATYVLFPNESDHAILKPPPVTTEYSSQAMDSFKGLLRNTQFLLVLIRTLDKEKKFTIHDRSSVASILMSINNDNMEYITEILKTLLIDLVDKNIATHSEKLLLRRSECVAEKLLTHWLSICLYHYLKEKSGSPLFILYKAIKIQIERGPVDYISNCAKFTLSEDKLLGEDISPKPLTLQVTHMEYFENDEKMISITALECDTITQVKSKMLEVFYKNVGYTQRPSVHSIQIEWLQEDSTSRVLTDEDPSSLKDGIWKRINTLEYYGVSDGAKMHLVHSRRTDVSISNTGAGNQDSYIGSFKRTKPLARTISGSNFWHLTKQHQSDADEVKIASDILLPRLLVTKKTLQSYVDDLFAEILCVSEEPPIIIKYLFDFLDTAAEDRGITDPEVLHTWKCNSLLLRFWVNIMKNPEFVFDIFKPDNVDKCLSVVAQAFMDSCSTADAHLGMGSPSNKLLFANDIPRYKAMVKEYFNFVKDKPAISDQDLNSYLTEKVSTKFSGKIHQSSALMEMYTYASKYRTTVLNELDNLEAGSPGQYSPLTSKLQLVYLMMDRESKG